MSTGNLRTWQIDALTKVQEKMEEIRAGSQCERSFCSYVSTGGGKTRFGREVSRRYLDYGSNNQVIVVTSGAHVCRHWAKTFKESGIHLKEVLDGNSSVAYGISKDYHGYVMTYQGLDRGCKIHSANVGKRPTMAIFDEVHHLGDETKWGVAGKEVFDPCRFRLLLSGTPFRSKTWERIPFIRYQDDPDDPEMAYPVYDFAYSYGQAVADRVCRQVVFKPYIGDVIINIGGQDRTLSFGQRMSPGDASRRLNSSIYAHPSNSYLKGMIREADAVLRRLRESSHPNAGAMLVAKDQKHAKHLANLLKNITGHTAVVVISEDDDAKKTLEDFVDGTRAWIISVKMVSEGVDIPRLRVLCYATNITEDLFFIQVMGRIVRVNTLYPGPSYFFMPADERLLAIASRIEDEIRKALGEKGTGNGGEPGIPLDVEFVSAFGNVGDNIIGGIVVPDYIVAQAHSLVPKHPELESLLTSKLVSFYCDFKNAVDGNGNSQHPSHEDHETLTDIEKSIRRELGKRVSEYVQRTGQTYEEVWGNLYKKAGVKRVEGSTIEQLKNMIAIVRRWIRNHVSDPYQQSLFS
jgi:superfamily II DNA or RNA helicase